MRSSIVGSSIVSSSIPRSSRVRAREVSAGRCRVSCSFIFFESAYGHADHLPKSNHRTKQQSNQIEPLSMQIVIGQLAQKKAQQDRRGNNKPHLGIASERDERIFLRRTRRRVGLKAGFLGHSEEF